jgi:hypothetical protein
MALANDPEQAAWFGALLGAIAMLSVVAVIAVLWVIPDTERVAFADGACTQAGGELYGRQLCIKGDRIIVISTPK